MAKLYVERGLRPSELASLKAIGRVGVVTIQQLKENYGITDGRIKQMNNSRYYDVQEEKVFIGTKGIKECEKLGIQHRYGSSLKNFEHDNRLAEVYFSIKTDKEIENKWEEFQENERLRDGWITEGELQDKASQLPIYEAFKEKITATHSKGKFQATPDAAYRHPDTGVVTCLEIYGKSYKYEDIAQKVAFAREYYNGNIEVY
ncbi:hypothetical protein [Alkalihalobacillus sp. BA299]|uniref:hypothetical protein n=1 Tax=Alkalihalobacillus sp. BA299 TaxID=2815938 RepID=UPI001ADC26FF|nr:hypothetical protein [Alkalihalobacillus sp. BA299]